MATASAPAPTGSSSGSNGNTELDYLKSLVSQVGCVILVDTLSLAVPRQTYSFNQNASWKVLVLS